MTGHPWRLALSTQACFVQAAWTGVRLMIGYQALAVGADAFFLGLLASAYALPALVTALAAGRLTDRVGGSVVALTGMFVAALGISGAIVVPGRWPLLAPVARRTPGLVPPAARCSTVPRPAPRPARRNRGTRWDATVVGTGPARHRVRSRQRPAGPVGKHPVSRRGIICRIRTSFRSPGC